MLRHRRNIDLRLLLSLMVLVAQLGATAHSYTHAGSSGDPFGAPLDTFQLCGQCQSSLPLFAAAASLDRILDFGASGSCPAAHSRAASLIEARAPQAFRSRAPPVLL